MATISKRTATGILFLVLLGLSQTSYGSTQLKCNKVQARKLRCNSKADCVIREGEPTCRCKEKYIGDGYTCEHLPSNLMNVAYKRPAIQSSTFKKYVASNAVDGKRNGDVKANSCSQTKKTKHPWWRVDLGKSVWVEKVLIANRKDSYYADLTDADIRIGDEGGKKGRTIEENPLCRQGLLVPKKPWLYSCAEPMLGKYVHIVLKGKGQLTLCEVEVYVNSEAIDKNIKYLVPRTYGRYLEKANYLKYAGNDHFYFSLSEGRQPKIPRKDIVTDLPPRKESLKTKDAVLMPLEFNGGNVQNPLCGPKNHDIYLNATFLKPVGSKVRVKTLGKKGEQSPEFTCKWEHLRVRGDICQLQTNCTAEFGAHCDTKYISSSFPPGSYHCVCKKGFVPDALNSLPGNVMKHGQRCKQAKVLKWLHSKQNVALKMKTTASSTDNYQGCKKKNCVQFPAFRRFAVDGSNPTCYRSLTEDRPWLMIHLNDYYPISLVRILTSGRILQNIKVYAGDNAENTHRKGNKLSLCAFKLGKIKENRLVSFGCNELYVYGNAVKIMADSPKFTLSLCEVEVYADTYVNIALKQFSKAKSSRSSLVNDGNLETCLRTSYWYLELGVNVRVSAVFILHERSSNLAGFDIVVGKDVCTTIPQYIHKQHLGNYFECKKTVVGDFLNITLRHGTRREISLCEVEVFQTKIINLAAKRPTKSNVNAARSYEGCDQKIEQTFLTGAVSRKAWWSVDLRAICKVHLVRVITDKEYEPADLEKLVIKVNEDSGKNGFGKGKKVASLKHPDKESVQTITLPQDTKARYVTLELNGRKAMLSFREVEVYNGPLLDVDECKNPGVRCGTNFRCQDLPNSYTCICDGGYRLSGKDCKDIDECLRNPCHKKALCTNTHGSYECKCNPGFAGDGRIICSSLNPCSSNKDCGQNQFCNNINGSHLCDCIKGYRFKGKQCVDSNECELEKNICGINSVCTNTVGSYKCNCLDGFESKNEDGKNCFDRDECKTKKMCGDTAVCKNTVGSFWCICPKGFSFDGEEEKCYDVDECLVSGSCGPNMLCMNSVGSYSCSCRPGYRARKNQQNCLDIDECDEERFSCPKFSRCENKDGGYECPCKNGYKKTSQGTCSEICVPECDKNSYCENGKCLCRRGFSLGLDYTCQASYLGSGISLQSSVPLLAAALLWCLALM